MNSKVPLYPVGFDHGNAESSIVILDNANQSYRQKMPSYLAQGSLDKIVNARSSRGDTYLRKSDALRSDEIVIEYQNREYLVGDLALRESQDASAAYGDISRYWQLRAVLLLLALSGKALQEREYALHVVTGLPVETFTNENREQVKERLSGEYPYWYRGEHRTAHITVAKVVTEGVGVLITEGESDPATLQGVIDIGGRTTDVMAARGVSTVADMSQGRAIGVEQVGKILSNFFDIYYKRPLSYDERRVLLYRYSEGIELPALKAQGKIVDKGQLRGWIEQAIADVAQDVASFVSSIPGWGTSEKGTVAGNIDPLFVVGGGTYYFFDAIKERIPHAKKLAVQSEYANAEGYAHLARRSLQRSQNQEIAV